MSVQHLESVHQVEVLALSQSNLGLLKLSFMVDQVFKNRDEFVFFICVERAYSRKMLLDRRHLMNISGVIDHKRSCFPISETTRLVETMVCGICVLHPIFLRRRMLYQFASDLVLAFDLVIAHVGEYRVSCAFRRVVSVHRSRSNRAAAER